MRASVSDVGTRAGVSPAGCGLADGCGLGGSGEGRCGLDATGGGESSFAGRVAGAAFFALAIELAAETSTGCGRGVGARMAVMNAPMPGPVVSRSDSHCRAALSRSDAMAVIVSGEGCGSAGVGAATSGIAVGAGVLATAGSSAGAGASDRGVGDISGFFDATGSSCGTGDGASEAAPMVVGVGNDGTTTIGVERGCSAAGCGDGDS